MEAPVFVCKFTKFSDCEIILNWLLQQIKEDICFTYFSEEKHCSFYWDEGGTGVELEHGYFFVAYMNEAGEIECRAKKDCPYCHRCEDKKEST